MSIKKYNGTYYTPRLNFCCRSPYGERSDEEQLKRKQDLIDARLCSQCLNVYLDWLLDQIEKHGTEVGAKIAVSIANVVYSPKSPQVDHFAAKIQYISSM